MRTIKFRGHAILNTFNLKNYPDIKDKDLVYGYYVKSRRHHYILQIWNEDIGFDERWEAGEWVEVYEETIGMFTGLQDKNGVDIYEGDICQIMLRKKYGHQKDNEPATVGAVSFGRVVVNGDTLNAYNAFHINSRSIEYLIGQELEITGNIHTQSTTP